MQERPSANRTSSLPRAEGAAISESEGAKLLIGVAFPALKEMMPLE
jgi:hypothetical protein